MLGNNYQNMLMLTYCNGGQLPVNKICFEEKVNNSNYLQPINEIYSNFKF
jgi:hypothetical protein